MRYLLTALLLLPVLVSAQELHTFRNGEVADANKLNESLQYILNNASGGCSVEQVDNSAEITCADGTTAVVPGYGTVVVYPEGTTGEIDPDSYNTGDIVVKDANDIVLAPVSRSIGVDWHEVNLGPNKSSPIAYVKNDNVRQLVELSGLGSTLYFLESDCAGVATYTSGSHLVKVNGAYFAQAVEGGFAGLFATKSSISNGGTCVNGERARYVTTFTSYTPAPEILNAAYPVRLEQLP